MRLSDEFKVEWYFEHKQRLLTIRQYTYNFKRYFLEKFPFYFEKNNPKKWEGKKGFPIRLLTSVNKKKIVVNNEEVTWLMYIFQSLQKSNPGSLDCVKALECMKKSLKYKDLSEIKKTVDNFRNR